MHYSTRKGTANLLNFLLLLAVVVGSQARTLLRQSKRGNVTRDVALDSLDVSVEGRVKQTNQNEYGPDVSVDEEDKQTDLKEADDDDDGQPPAMTQEELDKLQSKAKLIYIDLTKYPLARCMDGSPGGFYWKHASSEKSKNNWIIHLQGGGECDTPQRCLDLKLTALGSSNLFSQTHGFYGDVDVQTHNDNDHITVSTDVLLNTRQDMNPDFYDWNMVFVPYCSQDLWVGTKKQVSDETFLLFFSGRHILDALVDTLDNEGMNAAENLVLSGDSAGGYGVFGNVDRLASKHENAKTVGNPIGGIWTYAHPYSGPGHTKNLFSDFRQSNWPNMKHIWDAYYNEDCATESDRSKASCMVGCSFAPFPWTHIKTPLFITEANTDSVLAMMHNWVPEAPARINGMHDPHLYSPLLKNFLTEWGGNMTKCLKEGLELAHSKGNFNVGIFSPACYVHTDFSNIQINGRTYADAFADFFFKRGETPILIDEGYLTNPSCSNQLYSMLT